MKGIYIEFKFFLEVLMKRCFLTFILLICMGTLIWCQQPQYEDNGEVYVLIPQGVKKGVHKMNNTGTGIPSLLFTIEAGYTATKLRVDPQGTVYTFLLQQDTSPQDFSGNINVRINWIAGGDDGVFYGAHAYHHMYHDFPGGTSITATNHYGCNDPTTETSITAAVAVGKPANYIPYGWDVNNDGVADAGSPQCSTNWYSVPNSAIYHSFIRAEGYSTNDSITTSDGLGVDVEDNSAATRSAGNFRSYYTVLETQKKQDTDYVLYEYANGSGTKTSVATSREIFRYLEFKNGCHDGCISSADSATIGASEYKHDVAVSTFGDTYFYKRKKDGTTYDKLEKNSSSMTASEINNDVVGNINQADYLAVSSKSTNLDWVYLINDAVITNWMSYGGPGGNVAINKVAVSDQWWQEGGIVFSLDRAANQIYMIERNETMTSEATKVVNISPIGVPAEVDSIGTDGYGNLFFCKTTFDPKVVNPTSGTIENIINWQFDGSQWMGIGRVPQEVRKEIFKRSYYSSNITSVGNIVFGRNYYYVGVRVNNAADQLNPSAWMIDLGSLTSNPAETCTDFPAEITSVNYSTPPQVNGFIPAQLDIDGPYVLQGATSMVPLSTSGFKGLKENELYIFQVENYPMPNISDYKTNVLGTRAVNINSGDGSNATGLVDESATNACDSGQYNIDVSGITVTVNYKDSGSQTGGFVSTLNYTYLDNPATPFNEADRDGDNLEDSPKFRWILYQEFNRYGENTSKKIMDTDWIDYPVLGVMLDGGVYDLYVSSKYNWFDYRNLPTGGLSTQRWQTGVYMTDEWAATAQASFNPLTGGSDNKFGHYRFNVTLSGDTIENQGVIAGTLGNAFEVSASNSWVINEETKEVWEIKEGPGATGNRIADMISGTPPDPAGVQVTPGSKVWTSPVRLSVNVELNTPAGTPIVTETYVKQSAMTAGAATLDDFKVTTGVDDPVTAIFDESLLFDRPSDPYKYKFTMNAKRTYQFSTWITVTKFDPVTGVTLSSSYNMTYPRIVNIYAETEVLVRDIMESSDVKAISMSPVNYYVTSNDRMEFDTSDPDKIDDKVSPPTQSVYNPSQLTFYFEDDNPFVMDNVTVPFGFHNKGPTPGLTETAPNFNRLYNGDISIGVPASCLHQQFPYARLTYETFVPGINDSIASMLGFSGATDLISRLSQSEALQYPSFKERFLTNLKAGSGVNHSIPDGNDVRETSMWNEYCSGTASDISVASVSPGEISGMSTKKGYFKVTLNMPNLLRRMQWSFDSMLVCSYEVRAPQCNKIDSSLPINLTVSDSSGNRRNFIIGHIKVRDNDDPNLFARITVPVLNDILWIPENVKESYYMFKKTAASPEIFYYSHFNNGVWYPYNEFDSNSSKPFNIDFSKLSDGCSNFYFPLIDQVRAVPEPLLKSAKSIPEDTRIRIEIFAADNVTGAPQFNLDMATNTGSIVFSNGNESKYLVCSEPSRKGYPMSGEVYDSATDWAGNVNRNRRLIKYYIGPIGDTQMKSQTLKK